MNTSGSGGIGSIAGAYQGNLHNFASDFLIAFANVRGCTRGLVVIVQWGIHGFRAMLKPDHLDNGAGLIGQRLLWLDLEHFIPSTGFGLTDLEATLLGAEHGFRFDGRG
jgi:hypothetical protein